MKEQFLAAFKDALEIEDREIEMSDVFRDYDEWDSLARLSLIAVMDSEFDVQIESEEFTLLKTVEDVFFEVQKKKS